MKEKNKMICPACHSWDKDTEEEYDVIYNGIKGTCLNPICKAEWRIKTPNNFIAWGGEK